MVDKFKLKGCVYRYGIFSLPHIKGKQLATEEFVDNQISSSVKQIEENVASIIPDLVDRALVNTDFVIDSDYVHTDNNYTTEEKNKLNNITDAGSSTNPVYFSNGKPVATTYTLGRSVPSNAVFTDTMVTSRTDTSDGDYRLLLSWLASDNEDTNVAGKNSKFTANPSTGVLSAPTFNGNISWDNVTDKPSTYTPESHTHSLNDVSELLDKLVHLSGTAGAADSRSQYCVEQINDHINPTLETKADSGHTHSMSDITSLSSTIDSLSSTLNSINTALELHKFLKPFTKSSSQSDLIVRAESYVQYNDYLWKFSLYFTNAKNIPANTETVIATTSYPPKYDVVKTAVTIWKNDNSAAHTNNAIVKIKSNGDITITTPTAISGTGVNYARMNGEVFTAVNF